MMSTEPISGVSVAEAAYERIRSKIVEGEYSPNSRLHQGDLAKSFAISRTSVREALHRLTSESLVEFHPQRGFFVAPPLDLKGVLDRLQVRLLLEPAIAQLAAERRTNEDVKALNRAVSEESRARSPRTAHDRSREFHVALARATGNSYLVDILESLWTIEVGRQLLARRVVSPSWQTEDVTEHESISEAVAEGDSDVASERMRQHVAEAYSHWSKEETIDFGTAAAFETPA